MSRASLPEVTIELQSLGESASDVQSPPSRVQKLSLKGRSKSTFGRDIRQGSFGPTSTVRNSTNRNESMSTSSTKESSILRRWTRKIPWNYRMYMCIAVPSIMAIVFAVLLQLDATNKISAADTTKDVVSFTETLQNFGNSIMAEGQASIYAMHNTSWTAELRDVRREVSGPAIESLLEAIASTDVEMLRSAAAVDLIETYRQFITIARGRIDLGLVNMYEVHDFFTASLGYVMQFLYVILDKDFGATADIQRRLASWSQFFSIKSFVHREESMAIIALAQGGFESYDRQLDYLRSISTIEALAFPFEGTIGCQLACHFLDEPDAKAVLDEVGHIRDSISENVTDISSVSRIKELFEASNVVYTGKINTFLVNDIVSKASEVKDSAKREMVMYTILVILGVAFTLVMSTVLVTSMGEANEVLSDEVYIRRKTENVIWKFFPKDIMNLLEIGDVQHVSPGHKKLVQVAVMFADIRNFTAVSELLGPLKTYEWLMRYVQLLNPVVREHGGFVDKTLGDGILAIYPTAAAATNAAVAIQRHVDDLNRARVSQNPFYEVGIGIHHGDVILGIIGDEVRMEGTIVSDTVNTASRLEGLCKVYGSKIIVSDSAVRDARSSCKHRIRNLGIAKMVGKGRGLRIFEIFDTDAPLMRMMKSLTLESYEKAVLHYEKGELEKSRSALENVEETHRSMLSQIHSTPDSDNERLVDIAYERRKSRLQSILGGQQSCTVEDVIDYK